jgi:hypothetical protein
VGPSGARGHYFDYIPRADNSRRKYARVKSAESPYGGRGIVGLDLALECGAVNVQSRARAARAGNLEHGGSGANLLADAKLTPVETAYGQVLAEGSGKEGIAAFDEFVDAFDGDNKDSLVWTAVNLWMSVGVAFKAKRPDRRFRDGKLGNASAGDIDLDDGRNSYLLSAVSYQLRSDGSTRGWLTAES